MQRPKRPEYSPPASHRRHETEIKISVAYNDADWRQVYNEAGTIMMALCVTNKAGACQTQC